KLTAKISQQTLRNSLAAITQKLGLRFTVADEEVLIEPLPALVRLGRRSVLEELAAIDVLATTPFKQAGTEISLANLVSAIDQQLLEPKSGYALENRANVPAATTMIKTFKGQSLLDVLEEVHKQ